MSERELRQQLEDAQARLAAARAQLATPLQPDAELEALREELERLDTAVRALTPSLAAETDELRARRGSVQRLQLERARVALGAWGRQSAVVLASVGAGALGAGIGTMVLGALSFPGAPPAVRTVSGLIALASGAVAAWRLGRAR